MLIKKENSFYIYDVITQTQEEKLNVPYKGYIKFIDVLKGDNCNVYVLLTNECNIIFFNKSNIIFTIEGVFRYNILLPLNNGAVALNQIISEYNQNIIIVNPCLSNQKLSVINTNGLKLCTMKEVINKDKLLTAWNEVNNNNNKVIIWSLVSYQAETYIKIECSLITNVVVFNDCSFIIVCCYNSGGYNQYCPYLISENLDCISNLSHITKNECNFIFECDNERFIIYEQNSFIIVDKKTQQIISKDYINKYCQMIYLKENMYLFGKEIILFSESRLKYSN
jgi:hypothetical protein